MIKENKTKYYMHTIDNHPAVFQGQIVFQNKSINIPKDLSETLEQIKEEQKLTCEYRKKKGFVIHKEKLDYKVVYLDIDKLRGIDTMKYKYINRELTEERKEILNKIMEEWNHKKLSGDSAMFEILKLFKQ